MRVGKTELTYYQRLREDTREQLEAAELRQDQYGIEYYKGRLSILNLILDDMTKYT